MASDSEDFKLEIADDRTETAPSMWNDVIQIKPDFAGKYQPVTIKNLYIKNKTTMIYITKDLKDNVSL